ALARPRPARGLLSCRPDDGSSPALPFIKPEKQGKESEFDSQANPPFHRKSSERATDRARTLSPTKALIKMAVTKTGISQTLK
ncbi:hypothetical protein A2U01_0023610, partial [Trifolium medium]|nr:hypothetical protein [Trifolium medium]